MREARDASLAGRPLTLAARTIMVPLLVLLLGGCVAGRQRAPGFHSRPEGETAWRPPLRPFRADLRGRFRGPGGRARFRAGLGARPPDFRLDLFHPVSHQTLLSLGVVKGRLRAVWPAEGICLEAEGSPEIMEDLLAVRIHPEDLLPLLSGHFYRDEKIQILKYQTTDGSWQTVHGSVPHGRRVRVEGLDPATGARFRGELLSSRQGRALEGRRVALDGSEIRVRYHGWVHKKGAPFHPAEVRLSLPQGRIVLNLKIRAWAAGGPPETALWPVMPPRCRRIDQEELARGQVPELFSRISRH